MRIFCFEAGLGTKLYADGDVYVGEWVKGMRYILAYVCVCTHNMYIRIYIRIYKIYMYVCAHDIYVSHNTNTHTHTHTQYI